MALVEEKDDNLAVIVLSSPSLSRWDSSIYFDGMPLDLSHPAHNNIGNNSNRVGPGERALENDQPYSWLSTFGLLNSGCGIRRTRFVQRGRLISTVDKAIGLVVLLWGSTVLLGGFASELQMKDFVFVSLICLYLLIRVRCSSRVLEDSMVMLAFSVIYSCSVIASSVTQLASQHFGETKEAYKDTRNLALNVFYVMSLTDALLNLAFNALYYRLGELRRRSSEIGTSESGTSEIGT